MLIVITGDRNWKNVPAIFYRLKLAQLLWGDNLVVRHGGAKGADRIAHVTCLILGIKREPFKADWLKYYARAGPIRNSAMLTPDVGLVLGFHTNIDSSRGTRDCLKKARSKKMQWALIDHTMERST